MPAESTPLTPFLVAGVGGYDGYYTTGFLEEFRFLVDRRLEDHVFLPGGANSVLHAIVDDTRLPAGRRSLREHGAVRCNVEVERIIRTGSGSYAVSFLDKTSGVRSTETFSEVFFAAGPSEAIRLGLTSPQPESLPLMPEGLAKAMRRANLVGATKLAVKVPIDAFDGLDIPSNIQSTQPFQQVYVLPPTPGATSRVIFLSYQLGDNAAKTTALSAEEQFSVFVRIIANVALATGPGDAMHDKFRQFAELLRRGKDRMCVSYCQRLGSSGKLTLASPDSPARLVAGRSCHGAARSTLVAPSKWTARCTLPTQTRCGRARCNLMTGPSSLTR